MELKDVTCSDNGYVIQTYDVRSDEILMAKLGFLVSGGPSERPLLPSRGTDESNTTTIDQECARTVLAGNILLINNSPLILLGEIDTVSETILSGLKAIREGAERAAAFSRATNEKEKAKKKAN